MITIPAKDLYNAAKNVKQTEIQPLPILNHARLSLTDDGLKITTARLTDEGIKSKTDGAHFWGNGERWETCVPMVHMVECTPNGYRGATSKRKFYPFLDWLRVMAEFKETLEMEFNPSVQILTIRAGGSRTEFKCIDAQEFPPCR